MDSDDSETHEAWNPNRLLRASNNNERGSVAVAFNRRFRYDLELPCDSLMKKVVPHPMKTPT